VKRYFGFEPSDLLGQSVSTFVHPEDREKRSMEITALREGRKKVAEVVLRAFTKAGETVWIRAVISDQRHIPGVEGFVSNITDITPLITAQQEQEKLVHNLGERVKEQSLLYQAIAMLHVPAQEAEPDKVMASLARMLPSGWQYPEHTQASIELDDGRIYSTRNFKKVADSISANFQYKFH
jgi:PAS domain S-box-containing protein